MSETFPGTTGQAATQFVIPQEKIGLLLGTGGKTFKRIGSLFKVHIHLTSGHHQSGEWVSIYGKEDDRARAKEYIMSMCNPAVEEKILYPADLHEHLVGKGGKTHRYLESNSSAVITFSTACTAPNEHTAHIRGSKESVQHASNLVKEIMRKTQKRRQKESQPGLVKAEDLDKELLHILKITNNTALWENLKNETEQAKRNYINHLKGTHKFSNESSPSSSNDSGPEEGVCSKAELIAFARKLNFSEDDATKVLDRMGHGVNKNQFLANLVQFTRENDMNKCPSQPEQLALGMMRPAEPLMADRFRSNYSASPMFDYSGQSRAQEFAIERPNGITNMPMGMSARSIAPPRHIEQRPAEYPGGIGLPNEYLNNNSHFGPRFGQQESPLTLEQLISQHPSYAQNPTLQPASHPHLKTPSLPPAQLGHMNHILSGSTPLHGIPPQSQQQQHHSQLQSQSQLQLQAQTQSDKLLLQLLLLDQKDKEDRLRQKQEIEAVLMRHHQHQSSAVGGHITSEEQLAQLLLKRRMQQSKTLYAQQVGSHINPPVAAQNNTSNNSSGFGSAGNVGSTLNSTGSLSSNSGVSGPISPTGPFSDIFSPLSNGPDLYRSSFENEFGLDFLRENDTVSSGPNGEDVTDLIKQLKL